LNNIFQLGHSTHISNIIKKVNLHINEGWLPFKKVHNGNFYVNLCEMTGGGFTTLTYLDNVTRKISNLYSLVNTESSEVTDTPLMSRAQNGKAIGNVKPWFSFDTIEKAESALLFISKSKFMRAWLAIIKIDQNAAHTLLSNIPWLDWTQDWTEDRINSYFGFTQEEVDEINRIVDIITVK
jgi:hypothetical protein